MKINIQRFILFYLFILLLIFYTIFAYYFFKQEEEIAEVILKSLKNNIIETSYTLSKELKEEDNILSSRAMFDRIHSNQDFIKAIMVFDNEKLLLTTEPSITTIDKNLNNDESKNNTSYKKLLKQPYIYETIKFFEGKNQKKLLLVYVLEHNEIYSHFIKNKFYFILYFGFLPIGAFIFLLTFLRIYVSKPLELLRQYAYYNDKIPKAFKLQELESIRYSMVDSFRRLESEKNELYLMARTDSLSGLSNRNSLNEYIQKVIPEASRNNKEFAFLFLDMDHFKSINDSLGHNIGDELLQNIALIIKKTVRTNDFVARVGGDEFVIIIRDYHSYFELSNILSRIQAYISKPWIIQSNPINISCSIGVAFFPKNGNDIVSLMKNSDIAMYEAKKRGRNQYHFFTEDLNEKVQKTISLDKDMRQALENKEYSLFYQPKVDLSTSKIIGVEALIRWKSHEKGFISPDSFIPLAEENGFIKELGNWIIEETIQQHILWKKINISIPISINISAKQLLEENFENNFIKRLEENNIEPSKIDIEITEYLFIQASETKDKLDKLHDYGITISLDDFGTGYSSLSYLKKFPIDYLKIDKAFLDDFSSPDGAIFLDTIVKMGQMLNLKVIAEGVEKKEQIDYLKSISCEQYQGYFFSKPLSANDFEKLYKEFNK